jgi:hypothetical protein
MTTQTTNKLLILNSILLGTILTFLLILNYDALKNKLGHQKEEAIKPDYEDYNQVKHYPVQDLLQAYFEGFDPDSNQLPREITEIVSVNLKGFNWNNEFQEEDMFDITHQTILTQLFPEDIGPMRKWIIITFSNYGGNYCHAAAGRLSLFEFQQENQNWRMTKKFLAFGYGSDWGFEPGGCELVRIGRNNRYAAVISTSYSGQGHETESQSVYMEVDGSFNLVFDLTTYETYDGNSMIYHEIAEGYTEMRVIESEKAWFDIATKSEDADWQDKTFGTVRHFVFNGEEYFENPCWLYTDGVE